MTTRARPSAQAGLTLIELMIAMTITSIAVAAALTMSYSMVNGYKEHRRAVAVERQARSALAFVADAVRNASPGVASGNIRDLVGCTTGGAVTMVDDDTGPDELTVIYGSGGVITSNTVAFTQASSTIAVTDASSFRADDLVVITDFTTGTLVKIASVNVGAETLTLTSASAALCGGSGNFSYPIHSLVIRSRIANFYIDDSSGAGEPVLYMNPDPDDTTTAQPIAEGIEDLQVAVGVDTNADGTLTETPSAADEWFYNFAGDADPPLITATPWRAVRLTLTAHSIGDTSLVADSLRPAAENHPVATTPDNYRRRTLSTTIELRNITGSP